jgi:trigger factor
MSVVLSVEDVGPCRKQLKIEVPSPAVAAETDRVVREYSRQARLPGFRKGKVPATLVKQRFRKEIEQEVTERLLPRYWHQAEAEQQLDPLLPPELQDVELEGDSLTFTAVVETRPEVALGEYKRFELPDPPVEPTDEEVDQQLEELRRRAADWKTVERPAALGDRVAARIQEGEGEPQGVSFELGEGVWEELTLAVTGLTGGQSSTFRRRAAEGEEEKAYRVQVERVEERELPLLDDELAKKVSRFATLVELREKVTDSVRTGRRRDRRRRREAVLLEQLRQRHPLSLPEGVVAQEMESMVREYAHQLAHQGVDLERAKIDWGALAEQARPEAERVVHSGLLLDAIAEAEGIAVPEQRLEALLAEIARERKTSSLAVRRDLDSSGRLAALRRQLRRQETVRTLLGEPVEDGGIESAAGGHHHHDDDHGDHDHDHDHDHHDHDHHDHDEERG